MRAYDLNFDRVKAEYLARFTFDNDNDRAANEKWYEDLCQMMIGEGLRERGHLQIHEHLLQELEETHQRLLKDDKYPYYRQMYYKVLPLIVELRSKEAHQPRPDEQRPGSLAELTTCFNALYGVMLLRLQHTPLSQGTAEAVTTISTWLGQLSDYYLQGVEQQLYND